MHKELMEQENAIPDGKIPLGEGVHGADKGMTMQEDGKNYGDFLLDTIESAKDSLPTRAEAAARRRREDPRD